MIRTTLALQDDVLALLRTQAEKRGVSMGVAASDLIRNGARFQLSTRQVNGLPVFDVPADFPLVSDESVRRLLDEE